MPIIFTRKRRKQENTQSPPVSYDTKMAADIKTGAQSINTKRASLMLEMYMYTGLTAYTVTLC